MKQKNHVWNRVRLSLRGKNVIRNQILVSKLWYISQNYTIPKYQKGDWKKYIKLPLKQEKIQPPGHWDQLWARYFTVLDRHTIKLIKIKWIQRLLNPTNAPWKDLMWHWLKLIRKSDQDLALFWQKQILTGLLVTNIYKNRIIQLLYSITLYLDTSHQ